MTAFSTPRIAIAGFQHETNCFGVAKAGFQEFVMADSWPGLLRRAEVISKTIGMNLPIAGFALASSGKDIDLIPILWCAAEPSAHVTDDAFEAICEMLLDGLREAGHLDGIYLDLHGAMVTESHEDGEGEILRRVRSLVGQDMPVVVSLDLHANISREMVERSSYISIYRTYPHLDMAATGARCLPVLQSFLKGQRLCAAFRQIPYLIPLHAQYTGVEPCKSLYGALDSYTDGRVIADIALGFTAADFFNTGPAVVAYAPTHREAENACDSIASIFDAIETSFDLSLLSPENAIRIVEEMGAEKPVILADVQDNPGAGATSDTTGLINALARNSEQKVLMGLLHDPEVIELAHKIGVGSVFRAALGGKSGLPGQAPFEGEFEVLALNDGLCRYTGEMYGGGIANLGKSAALKTVGSDADITVVVTGIRNQCLDLAHFTHLGLNPAAYRIICVKSTVHFRAAFEAISHSVLSVAAPGGFLCDLRMINYWNLRPEVRVPTFVPCLVNPNTTN